MKTTSWVEVSDKLRRSLVDIEPETWICHLFSGFSVYFFLKAHKLGKWQGNLLMEMEKERAYTRLDNQGNPRTGYKSGFGDTPDLLYTNQSLIDAEFVMRTLSPSGSRLLRTRAPRSLLRQT